MSANRSREYSLEAELVDEFFAGAMSTWPRRGQHEIVREFGVGARRPDLVAIKASGIREGRSFDLSPLESAIARFVHKLGRAGIADISAGVQARPVKVTVAISRLTRRGLLKCRPAGYSLQKGAFPLGLSVIAVEAKLVRWREAIIQAASYREFAERSYVALPGSVIQRRVSEIQEGCRQSGIGLLSVVPSGVVEILRAPSVREKALDWFWVASRLGFSGWYESRGH